MPEQLVLGAVSSGNISWSDASIDMQRFMKIAMALGAIIFWQLSNACKKWLDQKHLAGQKHKNANCNEHLSKYITMKCADTIAD